MKKTIIICLLWIGIGFLIGKRIWSSSGDSKMYFIQEGVYDNRTIFENNITDLRKKVMEYKNGKIVVYVGITKQKELAEKIKNAYDEKNISVEIQERVIKSEELNTRIEQFDLLLEKTNEKEEIIKIEEVVLANYEEIMKNREEF